MGERDPKPKRAGAAKKGVVHLTSRESKRTTAARKLINRGSPELSSGSHAEPDSPLPAVVTPIIAHYVSTRPNSSVSCVDPPPLAPDPWSSTAVAGGGADFTQEFGSPLRAFSPFCFGSSASAGKHTTPNKAFGFTFRKSVTTTPSSLLKEVLRQRTGTGSCDSPLDSSSSDSPFSASRQTTCQRKSLSTLYRESLCGEKQRGQSLEVRDQCENLSSSSESDTSVIRPVGTSEETAEEEEGTVELSDKSECAYTVYTGVQVSTHAYM